MIIKFAYHILIINILLLFLLTIFVSLDHYTRLFLLGRVLLYSLT